MKNNKNKRTEAAFPLTVFERKKPAQLRQGEWLMDEQFLEALHESWQSQYADYIGEHAAGRYIDQLRSTNRLYKHDPALTLHAWVEDQIVGVTALRALEGIDIITMLEVLPAYQGKGIGSQLVHALCNASQRLMAHVSIYRSDVKTFYSQQGFHCLQREVVQHGDHLLEFDVVARSTSR